MRVLRPQKTALSRAKAAWQGHANLIRGELRQLGVRGMTRRLDDRARGVRGGSVTQQLYLDALDEARHGLPLETALAKTAQVVELTVKLAYEEAKREQQGPRSA